MTSSSGTELALVLFDCDGTLIDSQRMITSAMDLAFGSCHVAPPPAEKTLSIVGLSLPQAIAILAPDAEPQLQAQLVSAYKGSFQKLVADPELQEPLYDGARDTIEHLSAQSDTLLGVATGKSVRGVKRLFDREDFHPHFSTIQTADTNPSKPHPGMIEAGIDETGASARRTIMIGDTTFDMEMARNAGVFALGVTWGYHPADALRDAGAHIIAETFEEARAIMLEQLNPTEV